MSTMERRHENVVGLLLDNGATSLPPEHNNKTVLQTAVESGNQQPVKHVLHQTSQMDRKDESRATLVYAARGGHRRVVEFLINHGIDTSARALYGAEANDHQNIVSFQPRVAIPTSDVQTTSQYSMSWSITATRKPRVYSLETEPISMVEEGTNNQHCTRRRMGRNTKPTTCF